MSTSELEELKLDIEELQQLCKSAERIKVKDALEKEISKLQAQLLLKESPEKQTTIDSADKEKKTNAIPKVYKPLVEITTYAWDQSEKFLKVYVTINGIKSISSENIKCNYTKRSFKLEISELNGKNYTCHVGPLMDDILPGESYHKIKADMVLVMLKKVEPNKTWAYVTQKENKKEKLPKMDKEKDPSAGIMDMLKQMYDDGDDEMKRSIAKSWSESRDKQHPV